MSIYLVGGVSEVMENGGEKYVKVEGWKSVDNV